MFAYLKLLVRLRIAAWNPMTWQRQGRSKARTVLSFVGFGLLALMLYAMLVVLEYFLYGAFAQIGEPQTMLALTGLLCTVLVVVTSFFYVLNELFFSKDIAFMSALPISSRGLLAAKLLRIWLGEALIALLVCLPVVVLYGIGNQMGLWYYLKALLLVPLMPMAPLCVVTLLSFLLIRISGLWKRREALTIVMSMLFLVSFMYLEMRFSFAMDDSGMRAMLFEMITRQKQVLDLLVQAYPPIRWFTAAVTMGGMASLYSMLAFVALNIALLAAVVLVFGNAYQRLAVRQSEVFTRMNAGARRRVDRHGMRSPLRALLRREVREILTVPIYAMNSLAAAVIFPVISVAMLMSGSFDGVAVTMLPVMLALVPKPLIVGCVAALFAFTTSMNMAVATAVSREGKRHEFFQTLPVKPQTQLLAKFLMGMIINLICVLPIAIILLVAVPTLQLEIVVGLLISLLLAVATSLMALMMDVAHPKFGWKSETEAIKQNSLAALSMFAGMAFIAVCGGAVYGLTVLRVPMAGALLAVSAAVAVLDVLLMHRLLGKASNTYILQELRI